MSKERNGNGKKWLFVIPMVTLATLVFTVGGVSMAYRKDICLNHEENVRQGTQLATHDLDIRALERTQDRIDERLKSIDTRQQRIENQQLQIISLLQDR